MYGYFIRNIENNRSEFKHLERKDPLESHQIILEEVEATFLQEDLLEFHFIETEDEIGEETIIALHDWAVAQLAGKKCYLLVYTEPGAHLNQQARDYASSEEFDKICFADAIIRADYNHEMAANFFIRFNRPSRPVRLFPDREHALAWIQGLRDGTDSDEKTSFNP